MYFTPLLHHVTSTIARRELLEDTKMLRRCQERRTLIMTEAVLINEEKPSLNSQAEGCDRLLKIFIHWLLSHYNYLTRNLLVFFCINRCSVSMAKVIVVCFLMSECILYTLVIIVIYVFRLLYALIDRYDYEDCNFGKITLN